MCIYSNNIISKFPSILFSQGCTITSVNVTAEVSGNDVTVEFSANPGHPNTKFHCKLDRGINRSCK